MSQSIPNQRSGSGNLYIVLLAMAFLAVSVARRYDNVRSTLTSDVHGYYMYLPAVFVYGNIHKIPEGHFQGRNVNEKGESFSKYTCGVAYFYLPFFLVAHGYAHLTGGDTSGFSAPYCYAIMICGAFWAAIGLYFLKRLLLRYFNLNATWLTLLAIALGTNYFNYATLESGMSHVYSFTLFAITLYLLDNYLRAPKAKTAILSGVFFAWIILVRPTNAAFAIFLFLYRVASIADLKERSLFIRRHIPHLLIALPFVLMVFLPQLLYWKEMTGHWVMYSYENEHFIYWNNPKIARVLFDTRNGLFIYSPALIFSFWALIMRRKDPRTNFAGLLITFSVITYIFASWWAFWFGGAYGHRCYVEYYTAFAFPIAVTMERILLIRQQWIKVAIFFVLAFFCYYNIYLSELYVRVTLFDGPQWEWNWDTWIKYLRQMLGLPPIPGH